MKRKILLIFLMLLFPILAYAQSGCCSWHGGVDYCDRSEGKIVCNDGSYSPSCRCSKEELDKEYNEPNDSDEKNFSSFCEFIGNTFISLLLLLCFGRIFSDISKSFKKRKGRK